ncbi:MAG: IS630 family transposase [Schlesneria sp.]
MEGILSQEASRAKQRFCERLKWILDAELRTRYLIVIHLLEGQTVTWISRTLKISRNTVYRTKKRYETEGEPGLFDRRSENGERKVTEEFLERLVEVVAGDPQQYGWKRPTWTRELLIKAMARRTGIFIALSTMSQALQQIGARRGRPKPTVACPWPEAEKEQRLQEIQAMIAKLPPDEIAVYEDEIDIHLNPKIGQDWMIRGQQKEVATPGKNQKRYLAGAQDARTGELIYVAGDHKNAMLFVFMLWELVVRYPKARKIHVILDNFSIHTTQLIESCLNTPDGRRLVLHFLPPYCPDHNRIERTWQDVHANVTRNHKCKTMTDLMRNVRAYIRTRNSNKHCGRLSC